MLSQKNKKQLEVGVFFGLRKDGDAVRGADAMPLCMGRFAQPLPDSLTRGLSRSWGSEPNT